MVHNKSKTSLIRHIQKKYIMNEDDNIIPVSICDLGSFPFYCINIPYIVDKCVCPVHSWPGLVVSCLFASWRVAPSLSAAHAHFLFLFGVKAIGMLLFEEK